MRKIETNEQMYKSLSALFELMGIYCPDKITSQDIDKVASQMNHVIQSQQANKVHETNIAVINNKLKLLKRSNCKTLVISKYGIIRYQLITILNRYNIEVDTSADLYTGLAEYVKKLYSTVIIDVLDNGEEVNAIAKEIKRISCSHVTNTKVFILLSEDDDHLDTSCFNVFADKVICKKADWFNEIIKEHTDEPSLIKS